MDGCQCSTSNNVTRSNMSPDMKGNEVVPFELNGRDNSMELDVDGDNERVDLDKNDDLAIVLYSEQDNGDDGDIDDDNEKGKCDYGKGKTKEYTPVVPSQYIPDVGMEFESYEDAYEFYNMYAKMGGFGTRRHTSKKSKGVISWGIFVCNKQGYKKQKGDEKMPRVATRCGCKARIIVQFCPKKKKWVVNALDMEHNHKLLPSSKTRIHRAKRSCLENDSSIALEFFQKKRLSNTGFYYSIQNAEDTKVRNCFWVDAPAREDYYYFGDVVSFDTTYIKSQYVVPFAPFIGINHHNQSIILGCVLVVDGKKESFIWLFKEWLSAMGGRPPITIITDQDPAIKAAVQEVFPNSVHRVYLWHALQKVPKDLSTLYTRYPTFKSKWESWLYQSETREEFEERWTEMTILFPEIIKIEFVNDLWSNHVAWSSHYSPNTFMAGMSTSRRSESMNALFKKWVDASTPLDEFLVMFDKAIDRQRHKERKYDLRMISGVQACFIENSMLFHIRDIYTPSLFVKLENEFRKLVNCHAKLESSVECVRTYKVTCVQKDGRENEYTITYTERNQEMSTCQCHSWTSSGIICSHMLEVFKVERVRQLPEHYILKRWSRKARTGAIHQYGLERTSFEPCASIIEKEHVFFLKAHRCLKEALKFHETFADALDGLDRLTAQLHKRNMNLCRSSISIGAKEIDSYDNAENS